MSIKTDYQADLILNAIKNGTPYMGLFTTIPSEGGADGAEVSAASYARKAVTYGSPGDAVGGGRQIANSAMIEFDQAAESWGTAVGWGIWDALAGNLRYFKLFDGSATYAIGAGQQFRVAIAAHSLIEK